MKMVPATASDYGYIREHDHHILENLILPKIKRNEIYILRNQDESEIGWMRYGYFWDNTPFMNMIWIDEQYRGKGLGKQSVLIWEDEMKQNGFKLVMTSTLANEEAQHFYRNLGYRDAGCLLLENEPMEIIMTKKLI
ncbi:MULTISPECIES: GNAT family N-acetyltransferase [unclassified Paenibacillus]|uniref:GNAT family N-acetyltransferase n=1 Tax=unclassified Paenibacillus TaxID=185978 RepID=UPI002789FEFC|nr:MULTISPECIES: GNAT family N-acetyltransferase [unclassified Paenibacillus]MDQ0900961.1 ribosomal protein S18 acetylase RimI-like enzyme [Paenibacillus sp. V4I7]MDQ0920539.1 ribosomal protein S18 acetylase RimI-like enzyme [Paenibacillus sp. V4I5]